MKWDLDEAEGMFWIAPEAAYSLTEGMKKIYGIGFTRNVVLRFKEKLFKWYTLVSENKELGYKLIEKFKDKDFREKIKKELNEVKKELDNNIKEYKSGISEKELFEWLEKFTKRYREGFAYSFFAEPFDFVFPSVLEKAFSKYNLSKKEFIALSSIPDTSYLNKEEQELIKAAMSGNGLEEHYDKYEWMATGHIGKKKIEVDYFKKRVEELKKKDLKKELSRLKSFEKNERDKQMKLMEKYKFDREYLELIEIANDMAPLRDVRKEIFIKSIYYADDVREKIGKKYGYSLEEMQMFEVKDLLVLKKGKLDRDEIEKRKEFVALDVDTKKGKFETYSGEESKKRFEKEFKEDYSQVDSIEGVCASMGKVSGKVKVIYGHSGFDKMEKGDILFTGMTRPEMVPVMKKAAAIVTDEGGITCHAAIVSREFGIPCIVGTGNGSKVFKDGDMVEVDAEKGVVRVVHDPK